MPTLLIEIGTEELPAFAVAPALEQFTHALIARLESERLSVSDARIETFATPRRLTVRIADVPERQPDAEQEVRGPGVKAAYDASGALTKAALGFAAKQGVAPDALRVQGDYIVANRTEIGKPTSEVIATVVPELLKSITFPKFMRWGMGNYRFGRPLRRFVTLLDREIVPFAVEGAVSGRTTAGHRYVSGAVEIAAPADYEAALRNALVEPDVAIRRAQIIEQANALAETMGGRAILPENLIEENVYLTEWVTAVLGSFDPAYLALPRPVLTTSMQKNQRFFPVEGQDGNLLPHFIAIRNGVSDYVDTVRAGYEKVLSSRFNDARFFFEHDRQSTLAEKVFKTERIVFQERLGTLADKTKRLRFLLEKTGLLAWTEQESDAERAVLLAKADLATEIVAELPSLQGVMGREFALMDGESEVVAAALYEQYLPRTAGDVLPPSRVGTVLSLADRVDTLVGYMGFVGAEPKGSSDPFGLKRAAGAIVDMLARDSALPLLSTLLATAEIAYIEQGIVPAEKPGDLMALLETRLRALLEERGARFDLIDAVLAAHWDNIAAVMQRATVVENLVRRPQGIQTIQAATRIRNILRSVKEPIEAPIDSTYLTGAEENTLLRAAQSVVPEAQDALNRGAYTEGLDTLAVLNEPINFFFEHTLVMAEDRLVRAARLALLKQIDDVYLQIADFSRLLPE